MRDRVLDQAKGIAIIAVVAGHILSKNIPLRIWIYSFHIPLFLFVSGCLQAKHPSTFNWKFIRKEIRVLLYPFAVFSLLKAILNYGLTGDIQEFIDPLIRVPLMSGDGALWYLPAFFSALLLFVGIQTWKKDNFWIWGTLWILTLVLSPFISSNHPSYLNTFAFYANLINHSVILSIFLLAGDLYERYRKNLLHLPIMNAIYILLMIYALVFSQLNGPTDVHYSILRNPLLFYLVALMNCICILELLHAVEGKLPVLTFYGKNSLIVYLTHTTFQLTGMMRALVQLYIHKLTLVILCSTILVLLLEIPMIWFFNHWGNWLIHMPRKRHETVGSA